MLMNLINQIEGRLRHEMLTLLQESTDKEIFVNPLMHLSPVI